MLEQHTMPNGIINHFPRTAKHAGWWHPKQFTIPNIGRLVITCRPFTITGIILYSMFKDTINNHCDQKVFRSLKPFLLFKRQDYGYVTLTMTSNNKNWNSTNAVFHSTTSIFLWPFPQPIAFLQINSFLGFSRQMFTLIFTHTGKYGYQTA